MGRVWESPRGAPLGVRVAGGGGGSPPGCRGEGAGGASRAGGASGWCVRAGEGGAAVPVRRGSILSAEAVEEAPPDGHQLGGEDVGAVLCPGEAHMGVGVGVPRPRPADQDGMAVPADVLDTTVRVVAVHWVNLEAEDVREVCGEGSDGRWGVEVDVGRGGGGERAGDLVLALALASAPAPVLCSCTCALLLH